MNGDENGENLKKKIIEILKIHPEGLTIIDLAKIIGVHRQTVSKYILVLESSDVVYRRKLGSATLNYLKSQFEKKESRKNE